MQTIIKRVSRTLTYKIDIDEAPLYFNTFQEAKAGLLEMIEELEMDDTHFIYKENKITNGYLDRNDLGKVLPLR